MGLGTSRFPIKNAKDIAGIEKSAQLILKALEKGVHYIDTTYPYSAAGALPALKLAFAQTGNPYNVTVKLIYQHDKTTDEVRRRVESQLDTMGIDKATFFVCWCIKNYTEFMEIMRKGGVYDGAIRLKDEGAIDYICCSLHAPPEDSIKIIESGAFEAATISFNLANAPQVLPVLDAALKDNIDVAIMNPLGGGGIPRNPEFFSFAQAPGETIPVAALRYAKSHPAVKVVLCGLNNEKELDENYAAFARQSTEPDNKRLTRVTNSVKGIEGYCVNCHYCDGCPVGVPVSKIMERRNRLLFPDISSQDYKRENPELKQNIALFHADTYSDDSAGWFPDSADNPCIRCRACDKKCTQNLKIMDSIQDMYNRAAKHGFSVAAHKDRLQELLVNKGYKRVGLYPKDRFADLIVELYRRYFGTPDFDLIAFNSDPNMWGRVVDGLTIHSPNDINKLKPDIIIVCNYTYDNEIYTDLMHFENDGIEVVKLHRELDLPWIF